MLFKDQLGNTIQLNKTPKRIISLVPSQTELLVYLGLKDQLVGITKFCVHPESLRQEKQIVGGTKQVKLDKIRNLTPDLIIANKEENTKQMVLTLGDICPVWVSDVNSLQDNYNLIEQIGALCDVREKAAQLNTQIRAKELDFKAKMAGVDLESAVYLIWNEPLMGAGSPSFIDALLELNKFENLLANQASRYPNVSLKELETTQHLLLSSEPFPFTEKHKKELGKSINAEITLVNGEYFSWYGSRLIKAFDYFLELQQTLGRIS